MERSRGMTQGERRNLLLSTRRALAGRCPNCGEGRLFRTYLKQVEACACCGEGWAEIRSDDAAPWLTILVVGHVIGPLIIAIARSGWFETWQMAAILLPATLALSLLVLDRKSTRLNYSH